MQDALTGTTAQVKLGKRLSECYTIELAYVQGDDLSTLMFNISRR